MTKLVWNPRDKENLGFLSRNISSLRFMDKEWQASDESIAISIDILKAYSKNKEYTEFIQQGVAFFQRNKGNDKLYSVRDNVYNQQCLDEGGQDVIRCMLMTYENAVSRKKNYDDEKLKTDIDYSKKYMDAFTNEGKSLYPEGFPSYAELRKWQESHRN